MLLVAWLAFGGGGTGDAGTGDDVEGLGRKGRIVEGVGGLFGGIGVEGVGSSGVAAVVGVVARRDRVVVGRRNGSPRDRATAGHMCPGSRPFLRDCETWPTGRYETCEMQQRETLITTGSTLCATEDLLPSLQIISESNAQMEGIDTRCGIASDQIYAAL